MFWDRHNKCACGWSIGLLVLGVLLVAGSFPFFWFVGKELANGIEEAAVITSADPTVCVIMSASHGLRRFGVDCSGGMV
jgi:hypothetical protein